MLFKEVKNFVFGLIKRIEGQSIPVGSVSDELNFISKGDRVELRRGTRIVGEDDGETPTSVTGIHTGYQNDNTPVLFKKIGRKLLYTFSLTEDWVECGTDLFPVDAATDEATFANYQSLAGSFVFISSPNSSIYKVCTANPDSPIDLLSTTFRGYITIVKNRMELVYRSGANNNNDLTGHYLSWIDNNNFTTVSAEAIGSGGATSYTGTLAFKAGGSKRSCFGVLIKIGGTTKFTDDFNGSLIHVDGAASGSGTINYATGAYSITLASAAGGAVTADYQWEDSTDEGIADFSYSTPRVAGEGDVLRQDEGGPALSVEHYNDVSYSFHSRTIYRLQLSVDDTDADNNVFRRGSGIPNHKATLATGEGIYYVDTANEQDPQIRLLRLEAGSTEVIPQAISEQLDLTGYDFSDASIQRQGTTIIVWCKTSGSEHNNRALLYDTIFKTWDVVDVFGRDSALFSGALVVADSLSANVLEAFSGVDDNDAAIPGHIDFNEWDLDIPGRMKKCKQFWLEGNIGPSQIIDVKYAPDGGSFVTIGQIRGDASYVDRTQRVSVGPQTLGSGEIGGGGDGLEAYHYYAPITWRSPKFEKGTVRFIVGTDEATGEQGVGYFSCTKYRFQDIRIKDSKIPTKYRA